VSIKWLIHSAQFRNAFINFHSCFILQVSRFERSSNLDEKNQFGMSPERFRRPTNLSERDLEHHSKPTLKPDADSRPAFMHKNSSPIPASSPVTWTAGPQAAVPSTSTAWPSFKAQMSLPPPVLPFSTQPAVPIPAPMVVAPAMPVSVPIVAQPVIAIPPPTVSAMGMPIPGLPMPMTEPHNSVQRGATSNIFPTFVPQTRTRILPKEAPLPKPILSTSDLPIPTAADPSSNYFALRSDSRKSPEAFYLSRRSPPMRKVSKSPPFSPRRGRSRSRSNSSHRFRSRSRSRSCHRYRTRSRSTSRHRFRSRSRSTSRRRFRSRSRSASRHRYQARGRSRSRSPSPSRRKEASTGPMPQPRKSFSPEVIPLGFSQNTGAKVMQRFWCKYWSN